MKKIVESTVTELVGFVYPSFAIMGTTHYL